MANPISVPGTVVPSGSLISPGGAQGVQGLQGTTALADATQNGLLRQVSGNATDFIDGTNNSQPLQPVIWSARLRSFNAIGNPTFEVDQANIHGVISNVGNGVKIADRWAFGKSASATGTVNTQCANNVQIKVPGTNFLISRSQLFLQIGATQGTLAAGDFVFCNQSVEGPQLRELYADVSSVSVMAYSQTVAPITFAVTIRDTPVTKSIVYLLTIPTTGTWTLLTIPNIPAFPSGNFSILPGAPGYTIGICIACGTTFQAPSTGVWSTGNYLGAAGMTNGLAAGNNFYLSFIQHEPGPVCTTLMDKPFAQNYDECLRYYQKSYAYGTALGALTAVNAPQINSLASNHPYCWLPFKKPMAKSPTVVGWSPATGTFNSVRNLSGGADLATTAAMSVGDNGFGGFTVTGAPASNWIASLHYQADTGW